MKTEENLDLEKFFKWIEGDVSGDRSINLKVDLLQTIKTDRQKAVKFIYEQIHHLAISFQADTAIVLGRFDFDHVAEALTTRLEKILSEQIDTVAA
jgi:hypothetical protein